MTLKGEIDLILEKVCNGIPPFNKKLIDQATLSILSAIKARVPKEKEELSPCKNCGSKKSGELSDCDGCLITSGYNKGFNKAINQFLNEVEG